jgi:hypothetical protein
MKRSTNWRDHRRRAGLITSHSVANGELTIHAVARDIVKLQPSCATTSANSCLLDVTAIDARRERRFDIVTICSRPS